MDIDYPHALWITIWEIYGDSNVSSFPHDPTLITIHIPNHDTKIECSIDIEEVIIPIVASSYFTIASLKDSSTSWNQEIGLPSIAHWDRFLPEITCLLVESCIADIEAHIENISVLFDDSFVEVVSPLSPSDIHGLNSPTRGF